MARASRTSRLEAPPRARPTVIPTPLVPSPWLLSSCYSGL